MMYSSSLVRRVQIHNGAFVVLTRIPGESPINTPWMGLKRVFKPRLEDWSTVAAAQKEKRAKHHMVRISFTPSRGFVARWRRSQKRISPDSGLGKKSVGAKDVE
jgi:hypothetical protein